MSRDESSEILRAMNHKALNSIKSDMSNTLTEEQRKAVQPMVARFLLSDSPEPFGTVIATFQHPDSPVITDTTSPDSLNLGITEVERKQVSDGFKKLSANFYKKVLELREKHWKALLRKLPFSVVRYLENEENAKTDNQRKANQRMTLKQQLEDELLRSS